VPFQAFPINPEPILPVEPMPFPVYAQQQADVAPEPQTSTAYTTVTTRSLADAFGVSPRYTPEQHLPAYNWVSI
jgi:hypothetical protein